MTALSVSFRGSRGQTFEGAAPTFTSIGGGAGAGVDTVTFYQGANSGSRKVTASAGAGFYTSSPSLTLPLLFKPLLTDFTDLNSTGLRVRIAQSGSLTTIYREALLYDDGTGESAGPAIVEKYPATASWTIVYGRPTDTNLIASAGAAPGSLQFAITAAVATGAAKSENLFIDAIDHAGANEVRLDVNGGTGADPAVTFEDIWGEDEGTANNRWGIWTKQGQVYRIAAPVGFGISGASSAEFRLTEAYKAVQFVRPYGVDIEVEHNGHSTGNGIDFSVTASSFTGPSFLAAPQILPFDTSYDVDGTNERINLRTDQIRTGTKCRYYNRFDRTTAGSENIGLTHNDFQYLRRTSTAGEYELYDTFANCIATGGTTGRRNLTASTAANAEMHVLSYLVNTVGTPAGTVRFTHGGITSTTGSGYAYDGCVFAGIDAFEPGDTLSFDNCTIINARVFRPNSTTQAASGVSFLNPLPNIEDLAPNGYSAFPFLIDNEDAAYDLADFSDCSFDGSYDTTLETNLIIGGLFYTEQSGTVSFSGNTFTGDWQATTVYFDTENDVNGTTNVATTRDAAGTAVNHNFNTGESILYNKQDSAAVAGTEAIGLTDETIYWVRAVSAQTLAFYDTIGNAIADTNRISLTASGVGNGEDHQICPRKAAIWKGNTGSLTINVTAGGTSPSVGMIKGADVTVNVAVDVTITVVDTSGDPIEGAKVFLEENPGGVDVIPYGITNASGVVAGSYSGSTPQAVTGFVRKGTASPVYKPSPINDTISTSGLDAVITLVEDGA